MPSEHVRYKNPPIIEAVFDINAEVSSRDDLKIFDDFYSKIKDRFPEKNESFAIKNSIGFKDGQLTPPVSEKVLRGFVYQNKSDAKVVQARFDGFTFNKLKPYFDFEELIEEAKPLWELYKVVINPIRITAISFRYINTIVLPQPVNELKEYFLTYPEIGAGIPQNINNYFYSFEIVDPKSGAIGNVIQTVGEVTPETASVIFDITALKKTMINPKQDQEIWTIVKQLREFKNLIFNNSLTTKTKEMFQ